MVPSSHNSSDLD